ncbi:hypothetical protein ACSAZK_17830 [Methanosarcina sp. Mfa9]|uniref:hypothetical protein n=1 Tax=Methanosarcina sp. Mfa9 TaxID=3439063 RepID=UPI003F87DBA4
MKTRNRLYPIVVALFLLPFICATASAEMAQGTETQITTDESEQFRPAICGDTIVWTDDRNGNYDIYMYNLSTSEETRITTNDVFPEDYSAIYDNKIVWTDSRNENSDIYMYDFFTLTETRITTSESDQFWPAIYGDNILWIDLRNGNDDIYMYNLSTSEETQIATNESMSDDPFIYGNRIVWEDDRNGYPNFDIYMYDLATSMETQITTNESVQSYPAIYEDRIVWQDDRNGNYDIYMYNLSTQTETQITANESDQKFPKIYGDRIVWMDSRNGGSWSSWPADGNFDLYMYDLSTSREIQVTSNEAYQGDPEIYDNRIVWTDGRNGNQDIYMFTLAPAVELTPLDRTNDLKAYVENTLSSNMGTKKALIRDLDESISFLETGKDSEAVLSLEAFINLVDRMNKFNRISAAEADYMITEARGIINQINAQ